MSQQTTIIILGNRGEVNVQLTAAAEELRFPHLRLDRLVCIIGAIVCFVLICGCRDRI